MLWKQRESFAPWEAIPVREELRKVQEPQKSTALQEKCVRQEPQARFVPSAADAMRSTPVAACSDSCSSHEAGQSKHTAGSSEYSQTRRRD